MPLRDRCDPTYNKLAKREIVWPKFRHRLDRNRAPLLAAAPARVVPGGYASACLIAWIVLSKYVDHLPLYRQEQMSVRWGAPISRRSMCDWMEVAAMWLEPIFCPFFASGAVSSWLPVRFRRISRDSPRARLATVRARTGSCGSMSGDRGSSSVFRILAIT